jgi:hypothetical protein
MNTKYGNIENGTYVNVNRKEDQLTFEVVLTFKDSPNITFAISAESREGARNYAREIALELNAASYTVSAEPLSKTEIPQDLEVAINQAKDLIQIAANAAYNLLEPFMKAGEGVVPKDKKKTELVLMQKSLNPKLHITEMKVIMQFGEGVERKERIE